MAHSRDLKLEQFWRRHLQQQAACGLSIRDYCSRHDLQWASFYYWRRTIQQRDRQDSSSTSLTSSPAFVPVTVVNASPSRQTPIVIQFPGGARVRIRGGCDCQLLADVLTLLGHPTTREAREGQSC